MSMGGKGGIMINKLFFLMSEELEKEADSCNEYAQISSAPQSQRDDLYQRAGLLYSLSRVCENIAKQY